MDFWKVLKVLLQFAIHKCLKVHIPYPMSSSKTCVDYAKYGLMVNHINYNPACFPVTYASISPLLHADMHRTISHWDVQLHINHAE